MNPRPNRFFHLSLIFLVALNLVPHFNDYTVPTLAVGGVCLVWRLMYEYQLVPLPSFLTKLGLVGVLFYLVYQNFGQILGLEAGTALLICGVALKMIDRVGYRDAMVLLFLNFMLLLSRFFESQSLGITIFGAFDLIIATALLVQLHKGSQIKFSFFSLFKTGTKLFVQIAPFMVLLFFVFPRFSTGILQSQARKTQLNGFGSTMEPGSMSRLAQVDQPAFRVRFIKKPPSVFDMYWRGSILVTNQGMKWHEGKFEKRIVVRPGSKLREASKQEILLEPYFNNWLFTLDRGLWVEQQSRFLQLQTRQSEGSIFSMHKSQDKRMVYHSFSTEPEEDWLSAKQRQTYLQAPEEQDQRVLNLVKNIGLNKASNEQKATRLMDFYSREFRYTLEPGRLQSNTLAEFLFDKRVGFCEHFAVSFAALMRLAHVPSRVVVGFQGGRKNSLSDYHLVTSRDAHAWTEIWSDKEKKWLRFDPTTLVAPLRFELGGQIFHSLSEDQLQQASNSSEFLESFDMGWFNQAAFAFDAVSTNWNRFLLNFDRSGQQDFFAKLGIGSVNQNLLLTLSLLILLSFFLYVRLANKSKRKKEKASQKAYFDLRTKLSKKGIEKESYEGPSDFLKRAQSEWPEKKESLEDFRLLYLKDYYGEQNNKNEIQTLLRKI